MENTFDVRQALLEMAHLLLERAMQARDALQNDISSFAIVEASAKSLGLSEAARLLVERAQQLREENAMLKNASSSVI